MDPDCISLDFKIYTKNNILTELIRNQRKYIPSDKKLYGQDMKRIVKFIPHSILSEKCCCWQGYVTNKNNTQKGTYINFYFKNKKKALHRILFLNYKDDLEENEYIRFKCPNKGFCCSICCMYKVQFNKKKKKSEEDIDQIEITQKKSHETRSRSLSFDISFS